MFFLCGFSADVFLILQFLFRMGHTIGCFHLSLRDCKIWSFCCSCELLSVKSRSSERRKLVCEISALGSFELVSKLFFFFFSLTVVILLLNECKGSAEVSLTHAGVSEEGGCFCSVCLCACSSCCNESDTRKVILCNTFCEIFVL